MSSSVLWRARNSVVECSLDKRKVSGSTPLELISLSLCVHVF